MWRRRWWSRTMHDGADWIRERRRTRIGGELHLHLAGRDYRAEFIYGTGLVRYAIDREHWYDGDGARVDDATFAALAGALAMATHDCFGRTVATHAPSSAVFEIHFRPGMSPFGSGRRAFVEGRLADLMQPHLGRDDVTFEYPIRVDGAAPQAVRMKASSIAELEPIA